MATRNRRATDPYGRWCGGRELESPAYPILLDVHAQTAIRLKKLTPERAVLASHLVE